MLNCWRGKVECSVEKSQSAVSPRTLRQPWRGGGRCAIHRGRSVTSGFRPGEASPLQGPEALHWVGGGPHGPPRGAGGPGLGARRRSPPAPCRPGRWRSGGRTGCRGCPGGSRGAPPPGGTGSGGSGRPGPNEVVIQPPGSGGGGATWQTVLPRRWQRHTTAGGGALDSTGGPIHPLPILPPREGKSDDPCQTQENLPEEGAGYRGFKSPARKLCTAVFFSMARMSSSPQ